MDMLMREGGQSRGQSPGGPNRTQNHNSQNLFLTELGLISTFFAERATGLESEAQGGLWVVFTGENRKAGHFETLPFLQG